MERIERRSHLKNTFWNAKPALWVSRRRVVPSMLHRCSITIALALIATSAFASAVDGSDDQIANATCIADVGKWHDEGFTSFYRWLTMDKILLVQHKLGWHFVALDTKSGAFESLFGVDAAFHRAGHDPLFGGALAGGEGGLPNGWDGLEVAPGGTQFLWYRYAGMRAYTADIRGRGYTSSDLIDSDPGREAFVTSGYCRWLNSRGKWIELPENSNGSYTMARIHSAKGITEVALPAGLSSRDMPVQDVRCLDKRRSVQVTFVAVADKTFGTAVIDIGTHSEPVRVHKIHCANSRRLSARRFRIDKLPGGYLSCL
jgi:hypothetical protein